jgi:glutamate/tyrosine decarboxylase-like PLP-dependent enzyme
MAEPKPDALSVAGWFAGPKAENGEWFAERLRRIAEDYYAWRRNYFPEDGVVVDSALRRHNEPFMDAFEDRLLELLARLKADVPFQSPRYAAHMLAEQTLPGIAGYFAAMLYNPNNVAADVAPVTVRLELEAGRMLSRMIGYGDDAWAHLCSGGTLANIEALWMARTVRYLPFVVRDMRRGAGLPVPEWAADDARMLGLAPSLALGAYASVFDEARRCGDPAAMLRRLRDAFDASPFNVAERGHGEVCARLGSSPVLIAPETHHYCFEKALDVLGLGRRSLVMVRVDEDFRMRIDDLEDALDRVAREGRHVLAVVAVIGSTEEGSLDPLDRIVALRGARERAGRPSFWLHADGAYGAYLRTVTIPDRIGLGERSARVKIAGKERSIDLTLPEHGECDALEHLSSCDSVAIDPHKLGYVPYPAGAVAFRSNLVKPLARQNAPYLEEPPADPEDDRTSESIGLYVLEGSKPGAAAAAVWLSHSLIPLDASGHGLLMRENIRSACELHTLLETYPDLAGPGSVRAVCLCPPGSNIVCYAFRPARDGAGLERVNTLNRALYQRLSVRAGQRVYDQSFFVSRTSLSTRQYSALTVGRFLARLGVTQAEYETSGVFLLRSVLMNPWYAHAKRRARFYISELVEHLYATAQDLSDRATRRSGDSPEFPPGSDRTSRSA